MMNTLQEKNAKNCFKKQQNGQNHSLTWIWLKKNGFLLEPPFWRKHPSYWLFSASAVTQLGRTTTLISSLKWLFVFPLLIPKNPTPYQHGYEKVNYRPLNYLRCHTTISCLKMPCPKLKALWQSILQTSLNSYRQFV